MWKIVFRLLVVWFYFLLFTAQKNALVILLFPHFFLSFSGSSDVHHEVRIYSLTLLGNNPMPGWNMSVGLTYNAFGDGGDRLLGQKWEEIQYL